MKMISIIGIILILIGVVIALLGIPLSFLSGGFNLSNPPIREFTITAIGVVLIGVGTVIVRYTLLIPYAISAGMKKGQ